MNLHPVAQAVKSYGRGPDSMLVHMSPREVGGLQALAMANGGSLTINPETGLPEAGFLDKLLPAIIGFALGPAGFALMSPVAAGLTVGGIQALRTGDLGKGITAGLGAWGGAGIGAGLSTVGGMAAENTVNAAAAQSAEYAGLADAFGGSAGATVTPAQLSAAKEVLASPWNSAVSGAKAAMSDPSKLISAMGGGKNALMAAGAAAAPILADQAVQSGMPQTTTTSKIRRFTYDPYSQTYSPAGVYSAAQPTYGAEGGIMNLRRGGVARLAEGGIASFADGGYTTQQIADAIKAQSAATPDVTYEALLNAATNTYGVTPEQFNAGWAQSGFQNIGLQDVNQDQQLTAADLSPQQTASAIRSETFANPNVTYEDLKSAGTTRYGLTPEQFNAGWANMGFTDYGLQDVNQDQQLTAADLTARDIATTINAELTARPGASYQTLKNIAAERYGVDEEAFNQGWALYQSGRFRDEIIENPEDIATVSKTAVVENVDSAGKRVLERALKEGVGGSSGAGQIGGGTVINPNGTITTSPRIPGIPVGGFTGMQNVRDVYTQGGGRLGGVTQGMTPAQLAAKYQTSGDSKAAYDYLMGKGPYPTRTTAPEIYRPYTDITGVTATRGVDDYGRPTYALKDAAKATRKFIFDPETSTYNLNPDYREPFWVEGERFLRPPVKDIDAAFTVAAAAPGVGDAALQAMLDAGQFTIQEIADRLGISLADAKKRFKIITEEANKVNSLDGSDTYSGDAIGNDFTGWGVNQDIADAIDAGDKEAESDRQAAVNATIAAAGGVMSLAKGGLAQGSFVVPADVLSAAGNGSTRAGLAAINDKLMKKGVGRASLISGNGDGLSDSIPTSIEGVKPARVADGEAYIDPRTVKRLGGGDAKKGAAKLYAMMDRIRKQAHGKTTQQRPVNMAKAFA